jgi:hypothetical protein
MLSQPDVMHCREAGLMRIALVTGHEAREARLGAAVLFLVALGKGFAGEKVLIGFFVSTLRKV